jgi:hypothetical protein
LLPARESWIIRREDWLLSIQMPCNSSETLTVVGCIGWSPSGTVERAQYALAGEDLRRQLAG